MIGNVVVPFFLYYVHIIPCLQLLSLQSGTTASHYPQNKTFRADCSRNFSLFHSRLSCKNEKEKPVSRGIMKAHYWVHLRKLARNFVFYIDVKRTIPTKCSTERERGYMWARVVQVTAFLVSLGSEWQFRAPRSSAVGRNSAKGFGLPIWAFLSSSLVACAKL